MRKLGLSTAYLLRHLLVSPECLAYLVSVCIYIYIPSVGHAFAKAPAEKEYVLWIVGVLVAMSTYVFLVVRKVLWPNDNNRNLLLDWPGYVELKACCVAAIIHAALPVFATIVLVLLPDMLANGLREYVFVTFIVAVAFDSLTCMFAPISLSQILASANKDHK